jgi:hypothetical protein
MQRIHQALSSRIPGPRPVQRKRQSAAAAAGRVAAPAGVATLAPQFGQSLPNLAGVPTSYSHEFRAEMIYDLCVALVKEGLASAATWQKCGESALTFIQHAIMTAVGEQRWNLLQRNAEYHLQVTDVADRYAADSLIGDGKLAITIDCGASGFLKLGPALDALEKEEPGLGAAFYWMLTFALYRVMRLYNHDDALQYEERMREYAEEEDESEKGQYEFPEVEKALPEYIQQTLHHERDFRFKAVALLRRHRAGRYKSWIERLRTIRRLSRMPRTTLQDLERDPYYDSPPLPCLLVAFKEQDAVIACFDEESQYMLEGNSEPMLGVVFSPNNREEVRQAIRLVGRFVAINCELFELAEELVTWEEKSHAGKRIDRGEPSLRAA